MFLIFLNAMFVASLFIESVKLCASYLPSEGSPDNRLNKKSHSSKISLRKVALNKRNIYFSSLLLGTALSAVSRIIQCYRVLSARNLLYFCCTFFYRRLVSLDFTAFICPKTSSSELVQCVFRHFSSDYISIPFSHILMCFLSFMFHLISSHYFEMGYKLG